MKTDRRTERTNDLIFEAFLQLVVIKGYARVNVQDIVDHANIGRSTFYTHFNHKEDVLDSSLTRLFDRLYSQIEDSERHIMVPVMGICSHLKEFNRMQEAFGLDFISLKFQEHLQLGIFTRLSKNLVHAEDINAKLAYSHMLSGSFIALIKWWAVSGMKESPETIAEYFLRNRPVDHS